jgi:hypothetical protein
MRLFERCDDGTLSPTVDQAQELLATLTSELETVYICLDALDECEHDDKAELLYAISVLVQNCENLRVIVSSRVGDAEVSAFLEDRPQITLSSGSLTGDIENYIKYRIETGPMRLRRARPEEIIEKLASSADGMLVLFPGVIPLILAVL